MHGEVVNNEARVQENFLKHTLHCRRYAREQINPFPTPGSTGLSSLESLCLVLACTDSNIE